MVHTAYTDSTTVAVLVSKPSLHLLGDLGVVVGVILVSGTAVVIACDWLLVYEAVNRVVLVFAVMSNQ